MSARFCPKCGIEVNIDARFCHSCGQSIHENMGYDKKSSSGQMFYYIKKNPVPLLALMSLFLPILGAIVGVIYLTNPSPVHQRRGKLCLGFAVAGFIGYIVLTGG